MGLVLALVSFCSSVGVFISLAILNIVLALLTKGFTWYTIGIAWFITPNVLLVPSSNVPHFIPFKILTALAKILGFW